MRRISADDPFLSAASVKSAGNLPDDFSRFVFCNPFISTWQSFCKEKIVAMLYFMKV
jgi:hypothetical protein